MSTIRAFQAQGVLQEEFEDHQDLNTGAFFMFSATSAGFGFAIDLLVYIFIGCVIYLFVFVNTGLFLEIFQ